MKSKYKNFGIGVVFSLVFVLIFSGFLTAQNRDKISSLLSEDTLLIAYIRFDQLDAKEIIENNRPLISKLIEEIGLNRKEYLEEFFLDKTQRDQIALLVERPEELAKILDGGKAFLTSFLGIREGYCIVQLKGPKFNYFAIPKPNKHNAESLRAAIPPKEFLQVYETEDFLLIVPGEELPEKERDAFLESIASGNSIFRPQFSAAAREVEDYPIQILCSAPDYVKKIIRETKPALSGNSDGPIFPWILKGVNLENILCGISWTAIGFDPAKPELYCVHEAESEIAARLFYEETDSFLEIVRNQIHGEITSLLEKGTYQSGREDRISEENRPLLKEIAAWLNPKSGKNFRKMILPEPQGSRFSILWKSEDFEIASCFFIPILAKSFQEQIVQGRNAATRMQCANNLKTLGLAMHNYYDANKCFPPAFSIDEKGNPLHSWRVLLLPYLGKESRNLYHSLRLEEPWNSEHNRQFHDRMPEEFRCPRCTLGNPARDTNYSAVIGKETFGRTDGIGLKMPQILDGTEHTIMILERKEPICWMDPNREITWENASLGINKTDRGPGSEHPEGISATMMDGSVHFLHQSIKPERFQALLTFAGGERAEE